MMMQEVNDIAIKMVDSELPSSWVERVMRLAEESEGVHDLMHSWSESLTDEDRDHAIVVLQECLDDQEPPVVDYPDILSCRALRQEGIRLYMYKSALRSRIDAHGGVEAVARCMDVPAPALNRQLTSGAWLRASTIHALADALGVEVLNLYPNSISPA